MPVNIGSPLCLTVLGPQQARWWLLSYACCPWTWWRHQMETFSALLDICAGNSPVPVNSPHKGQWRGALVFSLICVWINGWVNNRKAGDLRRYRTHYDVSVMNLFGERWYWATFLDRMTSFKMANEIPRNSSALQVLRNRFNNLHISSRSVIHREILLGDKLYYGIKLFLPQIC